jgi:hypothetical protein
VGLKVNKTEKHIELELFAEELPDKVDYSAAGCCWGSGGSFGTVGCIGTCASSASTASTAACAC